MSERIVLPPGVVGYVFRTDYLEHGWSYIGQSTRLDQEHVDSYFGSGFHLKEALAVHGVDGLEKRLIGTGDNEHGLHYLEMLSIAEARRDGVLLLNGDFGGPRPFPTMQRALWKLVPEAMLAASNPKQFYKIMTSNRDMVKQAILDAMSVSTDQFYIGLELALLALEDLSHDCPLCGSPAGAVCRTNSNSLTKPKNPSRNHKARPRRTL